MTLRIHENLKNFIRPTPHSKYGPSSAERWMTCNYSIKASEGTESTTSAAAEEGTLAHSVCEAVYRQKEMMMRFPMDLTMQMLSLKDKGDEMMAAAEDFYEVCDYWMKNKNLIGDVVWFGQERGIPVYPERGCFGTGDFIIVGTKASVVIDFKYGRKPVKADSLQLKVYAAGIARHIENPPADYKFYAIIFQPRVSHEVKEHCYSLQEMYQALTDIGAAIDRCERDDNQPIEGSWCWFCPARQTKDLAKRCKLIQEKPLKLAKENFAKFLADSNLAPDTANKKALRDEAIIKLMVLLPAIEQIVTQSKEDFLIRTNLGEQVPGIRIIDKYGNRKLNALNDTDGIKMIKAKFPDVVPTKTVTKTTIRAIGDLEKELGKGAMDSLCTKKITKEVEVLDDKTQAILNSMNQFAKNISRS